MRKITVVISLLFLVCNVASANLILNGSFENNDIKSNSWKAFSAGSVDGWSGTNMELWDNFQNLNAFDGSQYAELNANGNGGEYSILQTFTSSKGAIYDLSFAYAARRNNDSFELEIFSGDNDSDLLFSQVFNDHKIKSWNEFYGQFIADSVSTTIRFSTINKGTLGNFLDNIVVNQASATAGISSVSVSEPMSLAVLSLSIVVLMRRKRRK
ncbi:MULTISPECIES: DUF642 domain-containing protein [unclassified Alteromonas]|uniref:DUF642 domain-containing protein n=1 Tax=unclassified Alteromonas TaxID=2614992 RepID=UPI000509BA11|nr:MULTISPECIES: DUF642 domain-containing protein [unclassified Alteromonas]